MSNKSNCKGLKGLVTQSVCGLEGPKNRGPIVLKPKEDKKVLSF